MAKDMWVGANAKPALTNLLDGGKFKNTTYWTAYNTTYTVSGFVATATSTGTWAQLYKELTPVAGHIYYVRVRVKYTCDSSHNKAQLQLKNSDSSTVYSNTQSYTPVGSWVALSLRQEINFSDAMKVTLVMPYTGSGTAMKNFTVQWNQPLLIDLTACFGAGNEPTQAWCDSNISFFDSSTSVEYTNISNVSRKVETPYFGVGNVVHKVKNGYLGVGGVARQFYASGVQCKIGEVPTGDSVNIGGNRFTVVAHNYKYCGFSGAGTVLWGEDPGYGPASWNSCIKTRSTSSQTTHTTFPSSAYNDTITSLAISQKYWNNARSTTPSGIRSTVATKFCVLSQWSVEYRSHLDITYAMPYFYNNGSYGKAKRYVNGAAVNHWTTEYGVTTEEGTDSDGNDYYWEGPWWYAYINTNGRYEDIGCGEQDGSQEYPDESCYNFYACEVSSDTLVKSGSDGVWYLVD